MQNLGVGGRHEHSMIWPFKKHNSGLTPVVCSRGQALVGEESLAMCHLDAVLLRCA